MIDKALIQACQQDDQLAFEQAYNLLINYAYSMCLRYQVKNKDIKDCVQEIFAETFFSIKKYNPSKGAFKYWFRKICVHTILKSQRKKTPLIIDINNCKHEFRSVSTSNFSLDRESIQSVINQLPAGYKTIFNLAVIDGFKHSEIAKMLGISESSSRSQLSRAKRILRKNESLIEKKLDYGIN